MNKNWMLRLSVRVFVRAILVVLCVASVGRGRDAAAADAPADKGIIFVSDIRDVANSVDLSVLDLFSEIVRDGARRYATGYTLMDKENAQIILKDFGKDLEQCKQNGRDDCEVAFAERVQADIGVSGQILKMPDGGIRVVLKMFDVAKRSPMNSIIKAAASISDLERVLTESVAELYKPLHRPVSGAKAGGGAGSGVVGSGSVTAGVQIDRGESIVNAMTDQTGLLFIETDPPKAGITINGKPYGKAPYQDSLMVGRYVIVANLNSFYHEAAQEVSLTTAGATVKLKLPPAFGTLKVTSNQPDAEVLIDDKPVGRTPYADMQMKSGEYTVEVRKDMYKPETRKIIVADGKPTTEQFKLADDFGVIRVTTTPAGASVLLDGKETGKVTPVTFAQVSTGLHVLTVDLVGHGRQVEQVKVTEGKTNDLSLTLEPKLGMLTVMTENEDGTPCQGTITIDGESKGATPWKGSLLATKHRIEVKCDLNEKVESVEIEHNLQKTLKLQVVPSSGIKWVLIPNGSFQMGPNDSDAGSDEKPVHQVTVQTFEIAKTEVTVGQYRKCVEARACSKPNTGSYCNWDVSGREDHPINCVNWGQASAYAKWVGGRLPTEAEWEYAARAGTTGERYGDIDAIAWYSQNSGSQTHPVGQKQANKFGLNDMLGNVWEWVQDWYHGSYNGAPSNGSAWENPKGSTRVVRGGSWGHDASDARAASRDNNAPGDRYGVLGLRPVRSVR